MKVAVDVEKLKIGMYVCELDRPLRETPFLFQGFEIRSQEELDALRRYYRSVQGNTLSDNVECTPRKAILNLSAAA